MINVVNVNAEKKLGQGSKGDFGTILNAIIQQVLSGSFPKIQEK